MKRFLFTYRWNGYEYSLEVPAETEAEARGRVSQMSLARFEGTIAMTVRVPGAGIVGKLLGMFRR